ncbi:carbohydrate ABC transporter permease [Chloroflexi bacterium TSY]|nr:carbohydrate ABC transporter permease [Chloroflexi bacterium TSY]
MNTNAYAGHPQYGLAARWADSIRYRLGDWLRIGLLLIFSIIILAPLVWMFSTSLRLPIESFNLPPKWIPTDFHLDNYRYIFVPIGANWSSFGELQGGDFTRFILNSTTATTAIVIGQLVTATLAGYAFAHLEFPGRQALFWLVMATMMIPLQATIIPVFVLMSRLDLTNSLAGLIIPAWVTAFGTFLLRQYFLRIPKDFEEAAVVDGANPWQVFSRVFLPLAVPGQAILAVLAFNTHWNEFFRPMVFLSRRELFTLPLGLATLQKEFQTTSISVALAGVTISMVLVLILYMLAQRYLIEGITMGGLKG